MTLNEIKEIEGLSTRTYNICRYNGLYNLTSILEYYEKHNNFKSLRNCGLRSNGELLAICKKYESLSENKIPAIEERDSFENIIANLTRNKRSLINSFIKLRTSELTNRCGNSISIYLKNNFNVRNFAHQLIIPINFSPINIPNVGKRTSIELEAYINRVKDFILEVSAMSDDKEINILKNRFLIQRKFSLSDAKQEVMEAESIFILVDYLLKENKIFEGIQNLIFKKSIKIYENDKEYSLNDLAEAVDLSRERVRQIRQFCLNELFDKLLFIKSFNEDLLQKYGIDLDSDFIDIDYALIETINNTDNTNFTKEFYTYLIYVNLSDSFSLLGEVEDVLRPKHFKNQGRHNWHNFYIVNKELINKMDFTAFVDDIDRRTSETIKETYEFNFRSYLSRFISDIDIDTIDLVYSIAEKILNDEFNLFLDLNDNLIFKRTTIKTFPEYVYKALDMLGEPSDIETIYNKVIDLYPSFNGDEESVRAAMKRENGFISIGRTSVYGLKKWEGELESFKGGTIRSISQEYLKKFNEPKHIVDITNYVLKYRPNSNQKSIYYNLKADESNTFVFYKNSHIGLNNKNYSPEFESFERNRKPWEIRYDELKEFLLKYNRLPRTRSNSKKERNLYRWLYFQRRNIKQNKLSEEKKNLINKILKNYSI